MAGVDLAYFDLDNMGAEPKPSLPASPQPSCEPSADLSLEERLARLSQR